MARSSLLPHAFVWEKCSEFQMTSPLEPLANVAQISFGATLVQGNEKLLKWLPAVD